MELDDSFPREVSRGRDHRRRASMLARRAVLVSVALLPVAAREARAQNDPRHRGFWIGFGVGGGWEVSMTQIDGFLFGKGGYLRLGATLNDRLLVGAEATRWASRSGPDQTWVQNNGTLTMLFYPGSRSNLFLKGGMGLAASIRRYPSGFTSVRDTDIGLALGLGVGRDIPTGRSFSVTPNAEVLFQRIKIPAGTTPPSTSIWRTVIVLLTVGVTWH